MMRTNLLLILGASSVINLHATILDTGSTGANCDPTSGMIVSQGGNVADDASCFLADADDQVVPPGSVELGPLADNGGPTATYELLFEAESVSVTKARARQS